MPHPGHHKDCDLALEPSTKTSSQVAERFSMGHWCLFWSDSGGRTSSFQGVGDVERPSSRRDPFFIDPKRSSSINNRRRSRGREKLQALRVPSVCPRQSSRWTRKRNKHGSFFLKEGTRNALKKLSRPARWNASHGRTEMSTMPGRMNDARMRLKVPA